jgi:hypothetical protein
MSLYATARLEILSAQQGLNKFALKSKLYINAIRQAFDVFSLFLRVILPCWYLILCFYERPLLSTVFGRLFQGGLPLLCDCSIRDSQCPARAE